MDEEKIFRAIENIESIGEINNIMNWCRTRKEQINELNYKKLISELQDTIAKLAEYFPYDCSPFCNQDYGDDCLTFMEWPDVLECITDFNQNNS